MLPGGDGSLPTFYRRLLDEFAALGATTEVMERDIDRLRRGPEGACFDFVHNGNIRRRQALNLGPAYLGRFHYVDPMGIFFESSIAGMPFRPETIPRDKAAAFVALLREQWVVTRQSRHDQPATRESFGRGHIAVFLQDWSDPVERSRFMDGLQMVETVLSETRGRRVVVKPHPRNFGLETAEICARLAERHPDVCVTDANLHDILAGAAVSVSISSSVALEGMLHGVPAILFGLSDLHHCAVTVRQASDWPAALDQAIARDWPFEAFLFWFLRRQNVWAARPFLPRVLDRMAAQGADFAALGIGRP
ncbi:MAG: hypothetical protein RIR62_3247 [Pseudomonadota bacterium]|jgi:hypothetical protein